MMLVALAGIWGASFLFIKLAVATVPPITITAGRITLAAVILYAAARLAGQARPSGIRNWVLITLSAIFGNALPFTLISWGEIWVDSGLAAILMAIVPLSTILLAHFVTTDEKLTLGKILGVLLGFAGILTLIGPAALTSLGSQALPQLAVAGGAVSYSIASLVTKRLTGLPGRTIAAWVMIVSAVIMLPASLIIDRPWTLDPSAISVASVIFLGIFPTAIAMLMLLAILRTQGASFLTMNNYLVPLFGLAWGAAFLGERPSPESAIALVLILAGIAISRLRLPQKA